MKWWTWDLIGGEWVSCHYALVSRDFDLKMRELLIDAIEAWLSLPA
jgi:hypothetical protein